mmetsp:Transcript_48587/g.130828  ORF Transcript_48587/g.130828 Transcript_48587/m.130828 type:complete len:212 (+) Transcript_48587:640-1275(+)
MHQHWSSFPSRATGSRPSTTTTRASTPWPSGTSWPPMPSSWSWPARPSSTSCSPRPSSSPTPRPRASTPPLTGRPRSSFRIPPIWPSPTATQSGPSTARWTHPPGWRPVPARPRSLGTAPRPTWRTLCTRAPSPLPRPAWRPGRGLPPAPASCCPAAPRRGAAPQLARATPPRRRPPRAPARGAAATPERPVVAWGPGRRGQARQRHAGQL